MSWNHLQGPMQLKKLVARKETGGSWQSKQKQNKITIQIFIAIFLIQYFCLHSILPFSKSYPETENTWSIAKCRWRKSFNTCFSKTSSKTGSTWSINSSKKLFCHVIVMNYLCNALCQICSKSKAYGGAK